MTSAIQNTRSNAPSRSLFLKEPERFEPDYGGWCAWDMAKEKKVEIDPTSFLIEDGRLLVFYDGLFNDTRKSWKKKGGAKLRPKADAGWDKFIGKEKNQDPRTKSANLTVGLEGNDPVSYGFEDGPKPGLSSIVTRLGTVEYRFLNLQNQLTFLQDPEAFLERKD